MSNETAREIFVSNLRRLMSARRITQMDIATAMRITPSTVSDWYLGKKYPRVDTMQRLADLLEVPMSSLTLPVSDFQINEITEPEKNLLLAYRAAEDTAQRYALEMLLAHPRADAQKNRA